MLAFHGDQELKTFVLEQLAEHREADNLIKGRYWEGGKGCAIGCTLEAVRIRSGKSSLNHGAHGLYETELGIPIVIAKLEDRFFEELPNGESQTWPERFIAAIKPGSDLTMVWPHFAHWLLMEECPQHTKNKRSLASLAKVGALYRGWINGVKPSTERWLSARKTAAASAYPAAYAADASAYAANAAAYTADVDADAWGYTYTAADAAADAAAYAANAAAYTAAYAADAAYTADVDADARGASSRRQSDKLIQLLSEAV